jgi:catechol 2,3-dioxygenase-like lactoylglutathione lyase family enzyme
MKINPEINHITLFTHDLDRLLQFYTKAMNFSNGARPDFVTDGAWLYLENKALIHLVQADQERKNEDPKIDHFAFGATGLAEFIERLKNLDIPYFVRLVPGPEIRQVVIKDPDGNMFEVMFDGSENADMSAFKWEGDKPV